MLKAVGGLFGELHGGWPPQVVALPGWMRTRADAAGALAGLDALALDLPGFGGASPPPAQAGGAGAYAAAVAPVLDAVGAPVVVVGHSFGGRVAVHLAAGHPGRVRALVLSGVPLLRRDDRPPPKVSLAHRAARWANRRGLLSDARMEARRRRHGSDDYRNATGVMRDVLVQVVNETYEEQLAQVRCPVRFVWGADDDVVPVRTAERAGALLPPGTDHTLVVVPGAGHLLPLTHPGALRAAIDEVLR